MTDKKIYISGPMTGLKYYNYPAFNYADRLLKRMGYETFNPASIKSEDNWKWEDYMRICIREISNCTHIYLLSGWEKSRGANIEVLLANSIGIEVMFEKKH